MTQNNRSKKQGKVTLPQLTFHKLNWLEWIAIGLGLWFLVYPQPYTFLFTILLVLPIVGLILNGLTGRPSIASLVEITGGKRGARDRYDVADFIDFPAIVIFARVLLDYEFESFYSLIIPGTITFVAMLGLLFMTHKLINQTPESKAWTYTALIFNIFLYSYSATYGMNCVYDSSKPHVYDARVIDKTISSSRRHTTYYIKVTPWGHHYDPENIKVGSNQYNEIQVCQTVKIDLKDGLFGIQWYYIER